MRDRNISDMVISMEMERPRLTAVLPGWELGVVLQALKQAHYESLCQTSFNYLTYKTVFLLEMASERKSSELERCWFLRQSAKTMSTPDCDYRTRSINITKDQQCHMV